MKSLIGYLAILLGAVGTIGCVVGCVAVWPAAIRLADRTVEVTSRVEEAADSTDEALGRVSGKLERTRRAVDAVHTAAIRFRDQPAVSREAIAALFDQLTPHLERADGLSESLRSLAVVLDRSARIADRFKRKDEDPRRMREVASAMTTAADALASVREEFQDFRDGKKTLNAKVVLDLAERIQKELERLGDSLLNARRLVADLRGELPEVREAATNWKFGAPAIATAVLLWVAIGQISLIGWGRRRVSRMSA
ncbi:MAG TPA: hypothetical protein VLM40_01255 [Gemmata sp.]|nr:hypothetical protein [Gemmata sp.]